MTAAVHPPLPAGATLAHYRIEEPVGEGAMGTVYRAHDEALDRTVALKVLRPSVSGDEARVLRFFREARAAARVNHDNLAHIYYVGEHDEFRFFAMEFIRGATLDEHVAAEGPLDLEPALEILIQAARGLAAAHEAGIVHRDVKPSNLLLRRDGSVKITDFGLSKSLQADVHATQDGHVLGTPTYMSPEQCRSSDVDARSDIYALGLTAWFLLTGSPPFPGPALGEVINDQINTPLPDLAEERPDLEGEGPLLDLVRRMCAKEPADRPQSMREVVNLLKGCMPRALHLAPLMSRGVAVIVDLLVPALVVLATLVPIKRFAHVDLFEGPWESVSIAFLWLLTQLYGEVRYRKSPGKWLMNLEVRASDGGRPRPRTALLRSVLRFPGIVIWALALPVAVDALVRVADLLSLAAVLGGLGCYVFLKHLTLSDLLTRTRVVQQLLPAAKVERRRRRRAAPAGDAPISSGPGESA